MKILPFLLSTIIATTVFAQNDQPDFRKLQVGVNFSPDYCFRTLRANDDSYTNGYVISSRNEHESPKIGYTTGLNIIYNFNRTIGLELGIQYSNKGYKYKENDLTFSSMIDPRNGFVYAAGNPISAKFIYNNYYIDLPLKVSFSFGKKKIRFITSAGLATNIFLKETVTTIVRYEDGSKEINRQTSNYDYNRINLSPLVSAGIDWKLSSKSNLKIEPTFRYGVLKIINDPVTGYLWNAGLNISYYFGL